MPKKEFSFELLHTVICDEIRIENNGKLFLIGAYPDAIVMNTLPAQIPLAIWMQFQAHLTKKISLQIEMKGDALDKPISFSFAVGEEKSFNKNSTIPFIIQAPFKIKQAGNIIVSYKIAGEENWHLAKNIQIKAKS